MSFQSESLIAWEALLEVMQEEAANACVLRWPVARNGSDKSGADEYDCIPAPTPDRLDLVAGGFLQDYQFSVSARRSDFTTLPVVGDLVLQANRVLRIVTVESSDLSAVVVLHLGSPDK